MTRQVGNWALLEPIGSGSFAVVWRAQHVSSGVVAAIKDINTSRLNGKLRASLASEISVLQRTSHKNLVALLDIIKEDDRLFLVLEFCAGGDLGHFLRRYGPVPESVAQHLLVQLAEGLKAMRALNLMHRDLKPQNLLLCDGSQVPHLKIADFGFARNLQPQGLAETLCGSPLYMAPEILQLHKYDAKADLWSVGAILFELVTGKPPYNGANHLQLLQNIERGEGGKLSASTAAKLSPACKQLLQQLLRRNPLERISFDEFFGHSFFSQSHPAPLPLPHPQLTSVPPPLQPARAVQLTPKQPQQPLSSEQQQARWQGGSQAAAPATDPDRPAAPAHVSSRAMQTGPLIGVHEATHISVHEAILQAPSLGNSHQYPGSAVAHSEAVQYTDIDLGQSNMAAGTGAASQLAGLLAFKPDLGKLSVIDECDDYVVVSTEPSPNASQDNILDASRAAGTPGSLASSASRGRGAWDALSRVSPALLAPRLVASAASQLRQAAASAHVNQWVAPLGQAIVAHVTNGSRHADSSPKSPTFPGRSSSATGSASSHSPSTGAGAAASAAATPNTAPKPAPSPTKRETQQASDTQQQEVSSAPLASKSVLTPVQLAQLTKVPEVTDRFDLLQRVLYNLVEEASKAWDVAVVDAEMLCESAVLQQHTSQPDVQGQHAPPDQDGLNSASADGAVGADAQAGTSAGDGGGGGGGKKRGSSSLLAAARAAAPRLRTAAAELVCAHLLCGQLLEAALRAAQQDDARQVVGGAGQQQTQRALLAAHARSILSPLQERTGLAGHLLQPDQQLPSRSSLLHQTALRIGSTAAMDEIMGQYSASVHQYAKAADLLLFLLSGQSSSWGVLPALEPDLVSQLHQLYAAVRIRQAMCIADLNSSLTSASRAAA